MPTREQEYSRVRELLDFPVEQKPSPHSIFSELIRQEQLQSNDLGNTRRPWTIPQLPATVTAVAGLADYTVTASDFGKALFVYRDAGNNVIVPVPFTDYTDELMNQAYEFFNVPVESDVSPFYSGSRVAFYRTASGLKKMRVFPIPEAGGEIYKIIYATGWLDWSKFDLGQTPILPEWSDLRTLKAAYLLARRAEWEGCSKQEERDKRREIRDDLALQIAEQTTIYKDFISNVQHEAPGDTGYWWE